MISVEKERNANLRYSEDFAGIALIQNHQNYILFGLEHSKRKNNIGLKLIKCEQGKQDLCFEVEHNNSEVIYLGVKLFNNQYYFFYGDKEDEYITISECIQAEELSTTRTGGFTGVYMGMYITGKAEGLRSYADFDWFIKKSV